MNKSKRAVLVIDEAVGKRILQLSLAEAYPKSQEVYLTIEFDDDTEILLELGCRPWFGIMHLARDGHEELQPLKRPISGSIQQLIREKARRESLG